MQGIHKLDRFPHVSMLLLLLKNGQWDVCTGRHYSAKECVWQLTQFLWPERKSGLDRIGHPDWVKLCIKLNCTPNQNTKFPSTTSYTCGKKFKRIPCWVWSNCNKERKKKEKRQKRNKYECYKIFSKPSIHPQWFTSVKRFFKIPFLIVNGDEFCELLICCFILWGFCGWRSGAKGKAELPFDIWLHILVILFYPHVG